MAVSLQGVQMLTRAGAAYERILARSVGTTGPIPGFESWLQEALRFIPWPTSEIRTLRMQLLAEIPCCYLFGSAADAIINQAISKSCHLRRWSKCKRLQKYISESHWAWSQFGLQRLQFLTMTQVFTTCLCIFTFFPIGSIGGSGLLLGRVTPT